MRIFNFLFFLANSVWSDEDTIIDMTPGGMPSPPHKVVGDMSGEF